MPIRVLHVVESLEPEAGSVSICLPGLFAALRAYDIESQTATLDEVAGSGSLSLPGGNKSALHPDEIRRLVQGADVVHVHGWGHRLARTISAAARRAAVPYIISPLGALGAGPFETNGWAGRLRGWIIERRLIQRASAVTVLNEPEEHELRARRVNANIVRLPYGICVSEYENAPVAAGDDTAHRASAQARTFIGAGSACGSQEASAGAANSPGTGSACGSADERLLLVLAPLHPVEGFVPLLKALAELGLAADDWNVVLAGRRMGDWDKMLEAAIRRKGGEGRVHFASAPDVAAQRTWLARAAILAAPSLWTRCPVSILQAVAAGVPVLATSCVTPAGLEEVIRVRAPSRGDLKAGLRPLLQMSDEERASAARRAREAARALFDWPVLVDRYVRLYQRLSRPLRHEPDTHRS